MLMMFWGTSIDMGGLGGVLGGRAKKGGANQGNVNNVNCVASKSV